jgi:ABC-type transport system substrate-binding protein
MIRAALLILSASLVDADSSGKTLKFTAQMQGGLFTIGDDIGNVNPHTYRPEEFTINDLVYEGLVTWDSSSPGADGVNGTADDGVVPSLAVSWSDNKASMSSSVNYEVTFQLRPGVTFHNGEPWNAEAAVLNFDHIMGGKDKNRAGFHDWFLIPAKLMKWEAVSTLVFKLTFSEYYAPALQELSHKRPFRMIAPAGLPDIAAGLLSCTEWKPWVKPGGAIRQWGEYTCSGILDPLGTGPYMFRGKQIKKFGDSKATRFIKAADLATVCNTPGGTSKKFLSCAYGENEYVAELIFDKFEAYKPTPTVVMPYYEVLHIPAFASTGKVQEALLKGELDMVYGLGTLSSSGFYSLNARDDDNELIPHISMADLNVRFIGFNSQGLLGTTSLRKTVMCSINRELLWDELLMEEDPMDTIFVPTDPYLPDFVKQMTTPKQMCDAHKIDVTALAGKQLRFLYPDNKAHVAGIAMEIMGELFTNSMTVVPMPMAKDDYNAELGIWAGPDGEAYTADDWPEWPKGKNIINATWDMAYSESWGPSYDPVSSLTDIAYIWPAEVWSQATNALDSITKAELNAEIKGLAVIENPTDRQAAYTKVLNTLNNEAIFLPLTAKRNIAVTRSYLAGFKFGPTEYGIATTISALYPKSEDSGLSDEAIIGISVGTAVGALLLGFIILLVVNEKNGKPIFMNLSEAPGSSTNAKQVEKSSA